MVGDFGVNFDKNFVSLWNYSSNQMRLLRKMSVIEQHTCDVECTVHEKVPKEPKDQFNSLFKEFPLYIELGVAL